MDKLQRLYEQIEQAPAYSKEVEDFKLWVLAMIKKAIEVQYAGEKKMTRVEAIKNLKKLLIRSDITNEYGDMEDMTPYEDAVEIAIEALKAQPCKDAIDRQALRVQFNHLDEVYEGMSEEEKLEAYIYGQIIQAIDDAPSVTPKPMKCEDAVRREAVIDTIEWYRTNPQHFTEDNLIEDIKGLPSVLPERVKGNWVPIDEEPHEDFECDRCGNVMCAVYDIDDYKFCPNCGADMRGGE